MLLLYITYACTRESSERIARVVYIVQVRRSPNRNWRKNTIGALAGFTTTEPHRRRRTRRKRGIIFFIGIAYFTHVQQQQRARACVIIARCGNTLSHTHTHTHVQPVSYVFIFYNTPFKAFAPFLHNRLFTFNFFPYIHIYTHTKLHRYIVAGYEIYVYRRNRRPRECVCPRKLTSSHATTATTTAPPSSSIFAVSFTRITRCVCVCVCVCT